MPIHHTDQYLSSRRSLFEAALHIARERAGSITRIADAQGQTDEILEQLHRAQDLLREMSGLLPERALEAWRERYQLTVHTVEKVLTRTRLQQVEDAPVGDTVDGWRPDRLPEAVDPSAPWVSSGA